MGGLFFRYTQCFDSRKINRQSFSGSRETYSFEVNSNFGSFWDTTDFVYSGREILASYFLYNISYFVIFRKCYINNIYDLNSKKASALVHLFAEPFLLSFFDFFVVVAELCNVVEESQVHNSLSFSRAEYRSKFPARPSISCFS